MDFFEHQDRARRKTGLLVIYFCLAVALITVAVYAVVLGIFFYGDARTGSMGVSWWMPDVFAGVSLVTLLIVAAGSLYKTAQLSGGGEVVAASLGGRPVLPNTRDLSERILLNVVEEMALASGTPVPPVFLLEEPGINAFAAGTSPQNAVIGVTRGAIQTLKRDELQGVIAHEFSHILNGDMRLNIRLMGVLHGILLIAMIGYLLMRTGTRRHYFAQSSSDKKGGNPLPLLGLCLYIIGYVGVFFGHLIKSAVSRQREFLADASAVQFTRYPPGIAGALKKIGGLVIGSRLQAARAEEASHMFFGNALRASLFQLLSTHPPLEERIRRIEPTFDGKYPRTTPVVHDTSELIDTRALAARRGTPGALVSGLAPQVSRQAFSADKVMEQVGSPGEEHLKIASDVMASLPEELTDEVHDPLGAVATIYALLLHQENTAAFEQQVTYLESSGNRRAFQETMRILPRVRQMPAAMRLPMVYLAAPPLHELSPQQLHAFRRDVLALIKADRDVTLFEYAVHRLIAKRLLSGSDETPRVPRYFSLKPLLPACQGLLSTLAYASGDTARAQRAMAVGSARLVDGGVALELLPREQTGLRVVDTALDQLAGASMPIKKRVLEACAACIGADGSVTVEEAELLRVIADAFDCPMPPLVGLGTP